jgi:hypothetical protein
MQAEPTVMEGLVKARNWGLVSLVELLAAEERVDRLRGAFVTACRRAADEDAVVHFGWLMKGIQEADASRNPLPDRMKEWQAHDAAEKAAKVRVALAQADEALALYRELPGTQQGVGREWLAQDESRLVPINIATLLKTRKAMLLEIAKGWRDAPTHAEAEKYFLELHALEREAKFREYSEPVAEVIREILAGHGFPLERIAYTIRKHPTSAHVQLLAHAWVKGVGGASYGTRGAGELIAILANSRQASEGALARIGALADHLTELDRKINMLQGRPHGAAIEYPDLGTVVIRYERKPDRRNDPDSFHQEFERVRDAMRASKGEWKIEARVFVEAVLREEFGEKKELAKRREQL